MEAGILWLFAVIVPGLFAEGEEVEPLVLFPELPLLPELPVFPVLPELEPPGLPGFSGVLPVAGAFFQSGGCGGVHLNHPPFAVSMLAGGGDFLGFREHIPAGGASYLV